jgi:hypothetical protein
MKLLLNFILSVHLFETCASFDKLYNLKTAETLKSFADNDAACDRQLSAFSDALFKREMWALKSKTISNSDLEYHSKLFQCSTLGLRSIPDTCHQLERTSATGILIDVWNSDTKFQALT